MKPDVGALITVGDLKDAIGRLQRDNERLEKENEVLREALEAQRHRLFGRGFESMDSAQLDVFGKPEGRAAIPVAPVATKAFTEPTKGHGRQPFAKQPPRLEEVLESPKEVCRRDVCQQDPVLIAEDVSERGHLIPSQIVVRRCARKSYACPPGHGIETTNRPPALIEGTPAFR